MFARPDSASRRSRRNWTKPCAAAGGARAVGLRRRYRASTSTMRERDPRSDAMAILVGAIAIGFYRLDYAPTIVARKSIGDASVGLRAFFIDLDWQGRGLGTRAVAGAAATTCSARHPERRLLALNVNCRNIARDQCLPQGWLRRHRRTLSGRQRRPAAPDGAAGLNRPAPAAAGLAAGSKCCRSDFSRDPGAVRASVESRTWARDWIPATSKGSPLKPLPQGSAGWGRIKRPRFAAG